MAVDREGGGATARLIFADTVELPANVAELADSSTPKNSEAPAQGPPYEVSVSERKSQSSDAWAEPLSAMVKSAP
jgi:hypothetical protein